MADRDELAPGTDDDVVFSEDERAEIRTYIDDIASQNRISPEEAAFKRDARPGVLIPAIVNIAAVVGILVGILVLRAVFNREEQTVQNRAIEYASIEGRLIRELQAESREAILQKEREIEQVRLQLAQLEDEQAALDSEIEQRLAEREEELRQELQAEIEAERSRLIAEGLNNEEIERLMESFEDERRAFYERQLAEYREELEEERVALQNEIDALRNEYQRRLAQLEDERQEIVEEFRRREEDLRVQLEQRTRVLEIARVEATANLEAAQRELAELERQSENLETVQNQIIGQIEQIQRAIENEQPTAALDRIDALTAYLGEDQVLGLDELRRRREMDLFLLRQLRSIVESRVQSDSEDERSITQELRLIGQIRRLSEEATEAPSEEAAQEAFQVLLDTLPEVSFAHRRIVDRVREDAVEQIRESEREIVESGTTNATTLAAAGDYRAALDAYVASLEALPAVSPDTDRIVSDVLRLGYAMTDYVIDGERSDGVDELARRAAVDIEQERQELQSRIGATVTSAVAAREAEMRLSIASRDERIEELQVRIDEVQAQIAALEGREADVREGFLVVPERDYEELETTAQELAAERTRLDSRIEGLSAERDSLAEERDSLVLQRDQLVEERAQLRARYTEYAQAQEDAIGSGDSVALANARDAFFLSTELDLFMPGLSDLVDEYNRQFAAEQESTGLSVFLVADVLEELSTNLTNQQRRLLLDDAIAGAEEDGDEAFVEFLTLLSGLLDAIAAN